MENLKYLRLTKINLEQKEQIIEFYKTHSLSETCKYFNISNKNSLKAFLIKNNIELHDKIFAYKRQSENLKKTCQERYGTNSPGQVEEFKEKQKQTMLDKYGVENCSQLEEVKEKKKQTCQEHYGVNNYSKTKEYLEKTKKTNLEKYGVEFYFQSDNYKEKNKQFNLNTYGTEFWTQTNEFKEKAKQTKLAKYGDENFSNKEKRKQTNLERYGTEHYSQTTECKEKVKNTLLEHYGVDRIPGYKYKYNNIYFDSLPELSFYLYYLSNNIEIKHEAIRFEYYFNGETHYYYPDFLVEDQLVEIKGSQFLKEDGAWQNPFDHSLDELYEAKHQCALQNNVKILYNEDYQKYVDWFNANYNIEDFKFNKNKS